MNWDTNSQLTWKARLFAAAVAASASLGGVRAAATTAASATSFVVVCPRQPPISSSSSTVSLETRRKCRHHYGGRGISSNAVFLNNESSSVILNNSRKIIDESPIASDNYRKNDADYNHDLHPHLSESDALRILRRSSSSSSSSSCRTPLDVLHILRRASNKCNNQWYNDTTSTGDEEEDKDHPFHYSSAIVDQAVEGISPNIAAAALRLLSSPPFLRAPSSAKASYSFSNGDDGYSRWGIRSERLHRHGRRNDMTETNDDSAMKRITNKFTTLEVETHAYERMISQLLKRMNFTIKKLLLLRNSTPDGDGGRNASTSFVPVLLPRRNCNDKSKNGGADDTMMESDETPLMDSFALTNLLHALSNLANVLADGGGGGGGGGINSRDENYSSGNSRRYNGRDGGGGMIEGHLLTNISPTEQGSIMDLFDSVIEHISRDNASISDFARIVGPRRLVRDVVRSLASMEISRRRMMHLREEGEEWSHNHGRKLPMHAMNRLLAIVSSYLALPHSLEQLTDTDLSKTLWSLTKLNDPLTSQYLMMNNSENNNASFQHHVLPEKKMLRTFMKRLRKYPIRSAASGKELVRAMWSVARLIRQWDEHEEVQQSKISSSLLHSVEEGLLPLSMYLPGEKEEDYEVFLSSSEELGLEVNKSKLNSSSLNDLPASVLREEAVIMFHTLINEIVRPPNFPRSNCKNDIRIPPTASDRIKLQSLDLGQIADILQAATDLHISGEDMASALVSLLHHLTASDPMLRNTVLSRCRSCRDISRVLYSLQRLRVGTGIFDNAAKGDIGRNANVVASDEDATIDGNSDGLESRSVEFLGKRFLELVQGYKLHRSTPACDGKTLAIVLRSAVLMFRETTPATTAILDAATILIQDEVHDSRNCEDWSPFLSSCNEFEVSSFLFAFAMARRFNQGVFASLTDKMTEDDILDNCTASSASRAMWASAFLLSQVASGDCRTAGTAMNAYKQIDLFHQLTPLLLSSSLSPTCITGAMWAMAKAEYVVDKGVFVHLAQLAASDDMLHRSNTRVVSQALWACAKMVEIESLTMKHESDRTDASTPYIHACYKYARFILENRNRISSKQLSRAIWAIGRLQLSDANLIQDFEDIALHSRI